MNFEELPFTPNDAHYFQLRIAKDLLSSSLETQPAVCIPLIQQWVGHLEKDGLKALNYMMKKFFETATDEEKKITNREEMLVTKVCSWWVDHIHYLHWLKDLQKVHNPN